MALILGAAQASASEPMKCETGPIIKTYGKSQWTVYSCADAKSVVFISAPGNPAMPFYFVLYPKDGSYRLSGEGTGRKEATAATYIDLKALKDTDIEALILQTNAVQK
jgi:hypothetical protein